jgi:hypothetical protein
MIRPISIAVAAVALFSAMPCLADDDDKDDARNLYVEQLSKPASHINSGISYWLELKKANATAASKVSNKKVFHSGDKLRFHVKPNFNGYAYVLMMQSSQGDHSVLFPTKKFPSNRIYAGRDIALPVGNGGPAWMKFDENPGKETLRVICSRTPIDPKTQFKKDDDTVTISSNEGDDTVPSGTVVSVESRNLTVEQSKKKPLHGSVTVVSHNPKKLLAVDIVLNHQD